jgi:hypothetical protein
LKYLRPTCACPPACVQALPSQLCHPIADAALTLPILIDHRCCPLPNQAQNGCATATALQLAHIEQRGRPQLRCCPKQASSSRWAAATHFRRHPMKSSAGSYVTSQRWRHTVQRFCFQAAAVPPQSQVVCMTLLAAASIRNAASMPAVPPAADGGGATPPALLLPRAAALPWTVLAILRARGAASSCHYSIACSLPIALVAATQSPPGCDCSSSVVQLVCRGISVMTVSSHGARLGMQQLSAVTDSGPSPPYVCTHSYCTC